MSTENIQIITVRTEQEAHTMLDRMNAKLEVWRCIPIKMEGTDKLIGYAREFWIEKKGDECWAIMAEVTTQQEIYKLPSKPYTIRIVDVHPDGSWTVKPEIHEEQDIPHVVIVYSEDGRLPIKVIGPFKNHVDAVKWSRKETTNLYQILAMEKPIF